MTAPRVVLAGFYPPPFAGEPIHVKQLADLLRERGFEVTVLNLNRHASPASEYVGASTPWGLMRLLVALPERGGLLHLHTNGHSWKSWVMIVTAAITARVKDVRTFLTIHSGLFPGYVSSLGGVRRRIARRVLGCFAHVIGVNRDIGDALQGLGVDAAKRAVIPAYLGVRRVADLAREEFTVLAGRRPVVVVVGGGDRDPELGLPTVIETLPELSQCLPDLRAVFVGWQVGAKTQGLIEARGLTEHAVCLGEIPHERCIALLGQADVVVRSTFADGDAITVREALELGVPVVASDTAFRPAGVTLFRRGDSRDLLAKLKHVLATHATAPAPIGSQAESGNDLWNLYAPLLTNNRRAIGTR